MMKTLLVSLALIYSALSHGQKDSVKVELNSNQNSGGFNIDLGVSLIRNTLTPTFNFNLHYFIKNRNKFQIGTMSNFLFEKSSKTAFTTYPNTFIKAEAFWKLKTKSTANKFDDSSWSGFGIAYLVVNKREFFNGPTFKIYHIFGVGRINIAPELIITNDFKSFYPGLTVTFL